MIIFVIRTLLIYWLVIFSMRMMGKRQLGELQPSELVTTFLISNLASICIEDTTQPLASSVLPVLIIMAVEIFNSALCYRFPSYSRFLEGKPVPVIRRGKVDQSALASLRISGEDLLCALRAQSVFDPQEVFLALVETNGTLAVYPAPSRRQPQPMLPLVIDGRIQGENLNLLERDRSWLEEYLKKHHLVLEKVFLLLDDGKTQLCVRKENSI